MTYSMENHHKTVMCARRGSKATLTKLIMQPYLDRGDHVHSASPSNHICYNGDVTCLPYVDEQRFTGPDTPKDNEMHTGWVSC